MLEGISWSQMLLPLFISLIIYYAWVLYKSYGKRLWTLLEQGNQRSWFDLNHQELSGNNAQVNQNSSELTEYNHSEFFTQLRNYLEPYRNSTLSESIHGEILKDLFRKFNPSSGSQQYRLLIQNLKQELDAFSIHIPENIDLQEMIKP